MRGHQFPLMQKRQQCNPSILAFLRSFTPSIAHRLLQQQVGCGLDADVRQIQSAVPNRRPEEGVRPIASAREIER